MEVREIIEGLERAIVVMDAALELRIREVEQLEERVVAHFDPLERALDDVPDERLAADLRRRLREVEDDLAELRHSVCRIADSSLYDPLRALRTDIALEGGPGALGSAPPLVVRARRNSGPDGWTFVVDELSVRAFGFTHDEALAELVAAVRSAVDDALTEPPADRSRRALAHHLQLADLQKRLGDVLDGALVIDDEHAERLLREHEEERPRGE